MPGPIKLLRADPAATAILTDVDGAIAPIVDDPAAAAVPAPVRDTLAGLAAAYRLVGCVSGRRVEQAMRMVGLSQLAYAGNHGFEIREPGADETGFAPELAGLEDEAASLLRTVDPEFLRAADLRTEDKGPIQALHWRGAIDPEMAEQAARDIAVRAEAAGLHTHWGRMVLELRPQVELSKGTAVTALVRGAGVRAAFYGGDDATDLDAFRALRALREAGELDTVVCVGISSAEGPQAIVDEADLVVDGPSGYAAVLADLLPAGT